MAAYLALAILLSAISFSSLLALTGAIIRELPDPANDKPMNRVERWALGEQRPYAAAVRGWSTDSATARPGIPITAILETEGAELATAQVVAALDAVPSAPAPAVTAASTYRTVCVRLCDGAYFPVSFSTTAEHLDADDTTCSSSCDSAVRLFFYKNPGEGPDEMVDRLGRSYKSLPAAFRFRTHYDQTCTCNGQPWEQQAKDRHRLYALELSVERGAVERPNVAQEIVQIRQRLIALRRLPAPDTRSPLYAAVAPEVVRDGAAFDASAVVAPVTAAAAPVPLPEPASQVPDPGTKFDVEKPAELPAVIPITEVEPIEPDSARDRKKSKGKARREARSRAQTLPRRRPRIIVASRPSPPRYYVVRRWASRTAADEMRRNLLRGSF